MILRPQAISQEALFAAQHPALSVWRQAIEAALAVFEQWGPQALSDIAACCAAALPVIRQVAAQATVVDAQTWALGLARSTASARVAAALGSGVTSGAGVLTLPTALVSARAALLAWDPVLQVAVPGNPEGLLLAVAQGLAGAVAEVVS